jgi:hypothetical protein
VGDRRGAGEGTRYLPAPRRNGKDTMAIPAGIPVST